MPPSVWPSASLCLKLNPVGRTNPCILSDACKRSKAARVSEVARSKLQLPRSESALLCPAGRACWLPTPLGRQMTWEERKLVVEAGRHRGANRRETISSCYPILTFLSGIKSEKTFALFQMDKDSSLLFALHVLSRPNSLWC